MSGYEAVFIIHVVGFGGGEYGSLVLLEAMMRGIDGAVGGRKGWNLAGN